MSIGDAREVEVEIVRKFYGLMGMQLFKNSPTDQAPLPCDESRQC